MQQNARSLHHATFFLPISDNLGHYYRGEKGEPHHAQRAIHQHSRWLQPFIPTVQRKGLQTNEKGSNVSRETLQAVP